MRIIRQVENFAASLVAKRCARVMPDESVRVYERNENNDTLREYEVPLSTVAHPAILRAARKARYQEYVPLEPAEAL